MGCIEQAPDQRSRGSWKEMAMQATVRAKGVKPHRSGLLTIVLVFAAGLSLGALVWAGIDEYRADDGNDAAVSAPSVKPSFNLPTDRTVGRSDGQVGNKYPDVYAEPGEPNSVPDYLQQTIQTDRAGWLEQPAWFSVYPLHTPQVLGGRS
jgi:hypothetical protein